MLVKTVTSQVAKKILKLNTCNGTLFLAQIKSKKFSTNNNFKDVTVRMPWGKLSGKLWGSENNNKQPILALHGFMDNAGSFDLLAPILQTSPILAVDLPGHGLSSWLPPGVPYNEVISIEAIRCIKRQFGWNKMKLLGHSMGGILCFNYGIMYPEDVQFIISLDSLAFFLSNLVKHNQKLAESIDKLLNFEAKRSDPPCYSEENIIKRWMEATFFKSLNVECTKILMIRGTTKKQDGTFYYNRDYKLMFEGFNRSYTKSDLLQVTELIKCPYFILKAKETKFPRRDEQWKEMIEVLKKNSKDFRCAEVEGAHHVHMTHPEIVAEKLRPFLEAHDI